MLHDSNQLFLDGFCEGIQAALAGFDFSSDDLISYNVTFRGTTYRKGDYLVIGKEDDIIDMVIFGEVIFCVKNSNPDIFFLVRVHQSQFNSALHVYSLTCKDRENYKCVSQKSLLDYYPLSPQRFDGQSVISLKHAV